MNYVTHVFKNYANFNGRARRSEYWYFTLFVIICYVALGFIDRMLGMAVLSMIFMLGVLVPAIAVGVRRMHDVGKPGWFILIPIYSLILACTDGVKGENEYGPDPKAVDSMQNV